MKLQTASILAVLLCGTRAESANGTAPGINPPGARTAVDAAILPLMARYMIPGMSVAIINNGASATYTYGLASKATQTKVTADTLFEVGSITKTFVATLASTAQVAHLLSLSDTPAKYVPALAGSAFDHVSLINLATHTSGGLPLQLPDGIETIKQLLDYYRNFKPTCPPGTCRTYGNPGIALLGLTTAAAMRQNFTVLMQNEILTPLGLRHTYLEVPPSEQPNYAQGYDSRGVPVRMGPSPIAAETYGIRTTAADLARYLQANMDLLPLAPSLRAAIMATHTGYFHVGAMTQDLVWEQYGAHIATKDLLYGNSPAVLLAATQTTPINPPSPPDPATLINKTGSTDGFSAYVLFMPAARAGVVLLANKAYPIQARVLAALAVLGR